MLLRENGNSGSDIIIIRKVFSDYYDINGKQSKTSEEIKYDLTSREKEVLKYLTEGASNTEIAEKLFISVHTAKAHVSNIMQKMGVKDRVCAAVTAVRENLV